MNSHDICQWSLIWKSIHVMFSLYIFLLYILSTVHCMFEHVLFVIICLHFLFMWNNFFLWWKLPMMIVFHFNRLMSARTSYFVILWKEIKYMTKNESIVLTRYVNKELKNIMNLKNHQHHLAWFGLQARPGQAAGRSLIFGLACRHLKSYQARQQARPGRKKVACWQLWCEEEKENMINDVIGYYFLWK